MPETTIHYAHSRGDRVRILELEHIGWIDALMVDEDGQNYRVRYWWDGDIKSIWLRACEIEASTEKAPIGISRD